MHHEPAKPARAERGTSEAEQRRALDGREHGQRGRTSRVGREGDRRRRAGRLMLLPVGGGVPPNRRTGTFLKNGAKRHIAGGLVQW
jgi:hypothetical protein